MNQSGLLHDLSRLSSQSQSAAVLKVKAEEIPTVSAYSPGILEFVNYHLSSLIMFENVKKKNWWKFFLSLGLLQSFFPLFLQYLQKYECRLKVFPLKWDTSWISLLCLATVFIKDGEILFLLNSIKMLLFSFIPIFIFYCQEQPSGYHELALWHHRFGLLPFQWQCLWDCRSVLCHQATDCCENFSKHLGLHWKQLQAFLKVAH